MQRILVPTDFSEFANQASDVAIRVAVKADAELHFLHMMGVPVDWIGVELSEEKLYSGVSQNVKNANYELDHWVEKAEKAGAKAKKFLQYQVGYKYILEYVNNLSIDLVVMGSHGIGGWGDFLVGSITQKMARLCDIPLLVINSPKENFNAKNIVFATDLNPDRKTFNEVLSNFASLFDAKIHGLFVNTPYVFVDTPTCQSRQEEFCARNPSLFESFTTYNFRTEEEGILQFAKTVKADVIVLITEGKRGLAKAFDKSVTETVIRYSKIPVLSLNAHT